MRKVLVRDQLSQASQSPQPPPLTVADVANHLGVSADVTRDLLRKKKLRGGKIGGQWRIRPEDLAEYVMATFERS
jgi:excisionase family DNA binding protein